MVANSPARGDARHVRYNLQHRPPAPARRWRAVGAAPLAAAAQRRGDPVRWAALAFANRKGERAPTDWRDSVSNLYAAVPPAARALVLRLRPPGRVLPPLRRNVYLNRRGRPHIRAAAAAHPA